MSAPDPGDRHFVEDNSEGQPHEYEQDDGVDEEHREDGDEDDRDEEEEVDLEDDDHGDSIWWQPHTQIETLQASTARLYGGRFSRGTVLAWRGNNTGKSVIVGYQCQGKCIGRVEPAARRYVDTSEAGHAHIPSTCRGRKKRDGTNDYWTWDDIISFGTVAWRVEGKYADKPTAVLRPMRKAWYPETYVGVIWSDNAFTFESRGNLRYLHGGDSYEVDVYIYRLSIAQDGDYQENLTGRRPLYPDGGSMQNIHWRNTNAYQGAYWLQPRARENQRVVGIEERPVRTDMDDEFDSGEQDLEDEEVDDGRHEDVLPEEELEQECEDWPDEVFHGDSGYPNEQHILTPPTSRGETPIRPPTRRRVQTMSPISEEFHTPYTPGNARRSARSTQMRNSRRRSSTQDSPPTPTPLTQARGGQERTPGRRQSTPSNPQSGNIAARGSRSTPRRRQNRSNGLTPEVSNSLAQPTTAQSSRSALRPSTQPRDTPGRMSNQTGRPSPRLSTSQTQATTPAQSGRPAPRASAQPQGTSRRTPNRHGRPSPGLSASQTQTTPQSSRSAPRPSTQPRGTPGHTPGRNPSTSLPSSTDHATPSQSSRSGNRPTTQPRETPGPTPNRHGRPSPGQSASQTRATPQSSRSASRPSTQRRETPGHTPNGERRPSPLTSNLQAEGMSAPGRRSRPSRAPRRRRGPDGRFQRAAQRDN